MTTLTETRTMRTTTQQAALIRHTLKQEYGWTSHQVSIKTDYFSMGSAIRIEIKDSAVPLPTVKAVAEQAERIRRDSFGEILSGGNTYVTVSYSSEVLDIFGRRYADAVQRAVNQLEPGSSGLEPVEGTGFLVGKPDAYRLTLWDRESAGMIQEANTVDTLAKTIGTLMEGES